MKKSKNNSNLKDPLSQIVRQLELIAKLILVNSIDKDFASHTQEQQIAMLGKIGFRNIEIANIFGIKRQQVNNAFRKSKK